MIPLNMFGPTRQHVEAVHLRHLDVEKDQIGRQRIDGFHCLTAIPALIDDFDLRIFLDSTRRLRRAPAVRRPQSVF